jgi:hypothetical protein
MTGQTARQNLSGWKSRTFPRSEAEELLDLGHGSVEDAAENLSEMQRINEFLGGTRALTQHLYPRMRRQQELITLVDLGTGGAGLPRKISRWARSMGLPLRILALDWSARNIKIAKTFANAEDPVSLVRADALLPPLASVDYVISSLFLHHFSPEPLEELLQHAFQVAGRAVIMSDLVRGHLPLLAFKLAKPMFARNYLTRVDGELSIRRSYTPAELLAIAQHAGLPRPQVYTHWPWRMTLVVEK